MKKKLAKEWSQVSEKETSQIMESCEWIRNWPKNGVMLVKKKLAKEWSQVSEKKTNQRMESSE